MNKTPKKKYIVAGLLVATISVSSLVMAHKFKQPNFEKLADKLELTIEQTPEFISVMDAHFEKRKAFKKAQRVELKEKMEEHQQQMLADLSAILNEEQLTSFEQHMEKRKERFEHRMKKHNKEY